MTRSIAIIALLAASSAAACTITTGPPAGAPAPAPAAPTAAAPAPSAPATPTPAPTRTPEQVVAAAVAAWSSHDANKIAELYSPDGVRERLTAQGFSAASGRQAIRADVAVFLAAFPDLALGVSRVLQADKQLVVEWVITGTNTGAFAGHAPTQKKMGIHGASVIQLSPDGFIAHERAYADDGMILAQLGEGPKDVIARPVATLPGGQAEWVRAGSAPEEGRNVSIVQSYFNGLEKNVTALTASMLADSVVQASYALPGDITGKDNVMKSGSAIRKMLDHVSIKPQPSVVAGAYVAVENEIHASLAKPGSKIGTIHELDVMRVDGGKIARIDAYSSNLESRQALGQ